MLWTLEQGLGPVFTPELLAAWIALYNIVATTMLSATNETNASSQPEPLAVQTSGKVNAQ